MEVREEGPIVGDAVAVAVASASVSICERVG